MYLRGFDRRGAVAAFTQAAASGFKVSGYWNDQVDFAVLVLHDEDDLYGHLESSRYLPDTDLTNIVLDTDVALTDLYSPVSVKYDSLQAGQLSYVKASGTTGATPLAPLVTAASGGSYAVNEVQVTGTPTSGDTFNIGFFGNFVATGTAGATAADVVGSLEYNVNNNAYSFWGQALVPFVIAEIVSGNFTDKFKVYAGRSAFANTGVTGQPPSQFTFSGAVCTIDQSALVGSGYDYRQLVGFWGLQAGDPVLVLTNGGAGYERHTVASVASPWSITLDSAPANPVTMVLWPMYGSDGNTVQFWLNTAAAGCGFSTSDGRSGQNIYPKCIGGTDLTSLHLKIDFTALGIDSLRSAWLTFAPQVNPDSTSSNAALQPFAQTTWSAVFSSWTVTDPSSKRPLKVAGPGSVVIGSQDGWCNYTGTWAQLSQNQISLGGQFVSAFYYRGFARGSATSGDTVEMTYYCQHTHDLYLGAQFFASGGGTFSVSLDGGAPSSFPTTLLDGNLRRKVASGVAAGGHRVKLTVGGSGPCVFDYLQAVVASDVQDPAVIYPNVSAAMDFDTDQSYKISPYRAWFLQKTMGFTEDIDLYAGVFFALTRKRYGGTFMTATVTLSGTVAADAVFVNIAGTSIGVAVIASDTLSSIAQRFCNAINTTFVGVWASAASAVITLKVLSPINGFALTVTSGTSITATKAGDLNSTLSSGFLIGGQEGVWQPDDSLSSPLNQGFQDWLSDFCTVLAAASQTCTVAFSQEILAPPDANTSAGAWAQRFPNGAPVLTATGFGSWGAGYVEAYSAPTVTQTGHGYVTGNTIHLASASQSGVWAITVTDGNHYQLTTLISGGYTPGAGDSVLADLQTAQCTFNPATFGAYLINCFKQTAGIQQAAGLTPRLQVGECPEWWFNPYSPNVPITALTNASPISIGLGSAHGFTTGDAVVITGVKGCSAANGTWIITVVDTTHYTLNGSSGNGAWTVNTGLSSGGGMAFYDAYIAAQASSALGRSLARITCQDTDPATCSADVAFLAGVTTTFANAVVAAIKAAYGSAVVEWLLPFDVNWPSVYFNSIWPYAQGGRINHAVNMPTALTAPGTSPFDRILMEGLAWGAYYRDLDGMKATAAFAVTAGWAQSKSAYLSPIFNGGCPWTAEYLAAINQGSVVKLWAWDHVILLSWPTQPMPANASTVQA